MNSTPLISCWSAKGGAGTSVFAAVLALILARSVKTVLVDAAGDQHAIFGLASPEVGFRQWAAGGESVPADSLARLAVKITSSLRLVPAGAPPAESAGGPVPRIKEAFPMSCIVVDTGTLHSKTDAFANIASDAEHSFAVVRPCYLAAQRLLTCDVARDGIIFVDEPGRVLTAKDMRDVLGDVSTTFQFDPALARVVDAGRIARRLPRSTRSLEKLARDLTLVEVEHAS